MLHGIRIALIMRIFSLAIHVPDFSQQHNISREQLLTKIFHLEIDDAMRKLATIFPKVEETKFEGDFGEVATYVGRLDPDLRTRACQDIPADRRPLHPDPARLQRGHPTDRRDGYVVAQMAVKPAKETVIAGA